MVYPADHPPDVTNQLWEHRLYRFASWLELTPLTGALVYVVFGFLALYLSDVVFVRYLSDPFLSQLQAFEGGVEVLLTGCLVFGLLRMGQYPLEQSNRKLKRRQEELQLLHRIIRHNLRNDLNVIMAFATQLRKQLPPDAREDCAKILEAVAGILHYSEQAALIRRVTEQDEMLSSYDLSAAIPNLLDQHELIDEQVAVSVDVPERAVVEANHMFGAAIEELLTNAIKHAAEEPPTLSISVRTKSDVLGMTELCVADNGPGIPDHVAERLGGSEADQVNHLDGLGLWFVYWAVSESNGSLEIKDSEMGGSCVRIWVPEKVTTPVGDS
jgi:signal transduction histidine kinase